MLERGGEALGCSAAGTGFILKTHAERSLLQLHPSSVASPSPCGQMCILHALLNTSIPLTPHVSVWLWASTCKQNKTENYTRHPLRGILKMGLTLHLSDVVAIKINRHLGVERGYS